VRLKPSGSDRIAHEKRRDAPHSKRWRDQQSASKWAKPLECGASRRFGVGCLRVADSLMTPNAVLPINDGFR